MSETITMYQMVVEGLMERFGDEFPCTCDEDNRPPCVFHRIYPWLEEQRDL